MCSYTISKIILAVSTRTKAIVPSCRCNRRVSFESLERSRQPRNKLGRPNQFTHFKLPLTFNGWSIYTWMLEVSQWQSEGYFCRRKRISAFGIGRLRKEHVGILFKNDPRRILAGVSDWTNFNENVWFIRLQYFWNSTRQPMSSIPLILKTPPKYFRESYGQNWNLVWWLK